MVHNSPREAGFIPVVQTLSGKFPSPGSEKLKASQKVPTIPFNPNNIKHLSNKPTERGINAKSRTLGHMRPKTRCENFVGTNNGTYKQSHSE